MNLQSFCSTDEGRPYLRSPFSRGEYTFASNGHIAVRVPRRDDVPEREDDNPKIEPLFEGMPEDGFEPVPSVTFENEDESECTDCDGRGSAHDCPTCRCQCSTCSGSGILPPWHDTSVGIGEALFAGRYIAMLQSLPNVVLTAPCKEVSPNWKAAFFRFDGGDGILMPLSGKLSTHIDAKPATPIPPDPDSEFPEREALASAVMDDETDGDERCPPLVGLNPSA